MRFREKRLIHGGIGIAAALALSACGGGGNESGPAETLVASPTSVTATGPSPTSCAAGTGPTIFVYGGQPPYKLTNSAPTALAISVTTLHSSGDGFVVTFLGQCLSQIPINIEDDDGRILAVPISNVLGT